MQRSKTDRMDASFKLISATGIRILAKSPVFVFGLSLTKDKNKNLFKIFTILKEGNGRNRFQASANRTFQKRDSLGTRMQACPASLRLHIPEHPANPNGHPPAHCTCNGAQSRKPKTPGIHHKKNPCRSCSSKDSSSAQGLRPPPLPKRPKSPMAVGMGYPASSPVSHPFRHTTKDGMGTLG